MPNNPAPSSAILWPLFAMMALVAVVSMLMLRERIRQFKAERIHPQKVALRGQFAALVRDTRCADNFSNLFETPVMFYVVCLGLYATHTAGTVALALAWLYVLLRCAHSAVQCGSNVVMTRFKIFMASMGTLGALWVTWALALVAA